MGFSGPRAGPGSREVPVPCGHMLLCTRRVVAGTRYRVHSMAQAALESQACVHSGLGSHLQCQSCVSRRKTGRLLLAVQGRTPHTPHSRRQCSLMPLFPFCRANTPAPTHAHAHARAHWRTKNCSQPQRPQRPQRPQCPRGPSALTLAFPALRDPRPPEWDRCDLADIVSSSGRAASPPSRAEQAGHAYIPRSQDHETTMAQAPELRPGGAHQTARRVLRAKARARARVRGQNQSGMWAT